MNRLEEFKFQVNREKRRNFRRKYYKRNRPNLLELIPTPLNLTLDKNNSLKWNDANQKSAKAIIQETSETTPNQNLNKKTSTNVSSEKPGENKWHQSRIDIQSLLNDIYVEESAVIKWVLTVKLANMLVALNNEGLWSRDTNDPEFFQEIKSLIIKEYYILFLISPANGFIITTNQLKCIQVFTSLFDFSSFFDNNQSILKLLIMNFFENDAAKTNLPLKIQILLNIPCQSLFKHLVFILQEGLYALDSQIPEIQAHVVYPDFEICKQFSTVLFFFLSLLNQYFDQIKNLKESNDIRGQEMESLLLFILNNSQRLIDYLSFLICNHSKSFSEFVTKNKDFRSLSYHFNLLSKLVDTNPAWASKIDFSETLYKYMLFKQAIYEAEDLRLSGFDDGFAQFLGFLNSLINFHEIPFHMEFDFEIFYLKFGPLFFKLLKK